LSISNALEYDPSLTAKTTFKSCSWIDRFGLTGPSAGNKQRRVSVSITKHIIQNNQHIILPFITMISILQFNLPSSVPPSVSLVQLSIFTPYLCLPSMPPMPSPISLGNAGGNLAMIRIPCNDPLIHPSCYISLRLCIFLYLYKLYSITSCHDASCTHNHRSRRQTRGCLPPVSCSQFL
jgi:hypothetical protein